MYEECVSNRLAACAWVILGLSLASCERPPGADALSTLEVGASEAEVLDALPEGGIVAAPDGNPLLVVQGYWKDQYLIEGSSIEVLWVHDPALGFPEGELRDGVTPVVFVDDRLDGWGWSYFDERRGEWGIGDRPTGVPAGGEPEAEPGGGGPTV